MSAKRRCAAQWTVKFAGEWLKCLAWEDATAAGLVCTAWRDALQSLSLNSLESLRLWHFNGRTPPRVGRPVDARLVEVHDPAVAERFWAKQNATSAAVLRALFALEQPRVVVAGGSVWRAMQADASHISNWRADVDVFFCNYDGASFSEDSATVKRLLEGVSTPDAILALYSNTVNVVFEDHSPPLQLVLRRVHSVEELLLSFDLDCCRFAFDGRRVWTVDEGLRALATNTNVVNLQHARNSTYYKRAVKYGLRGVQTVFRPRDLLARFHNAADTSRDQQAQFIEGRFEEDDTTGFYNTVRDLDFGELRRLHATGPTSPADACDDKSYAQAMFLYHLRKIRIALGLTFVELFERDARDFFTEGYRDQHLFRKYHIVRCYRCGVFAQTGSAAACKAYRFCAACDVLEREQVASRRRLDGLHAVVTGGRVNVGYAVALRLLRCAVLSLVVGGCLFGFWHKLFIVRMSGQVPTWSLQLVSPKVARGSTARRATSANGRPGFACTRSTCAASNLSTAFASGWPRRSGPCA
jgi:hypothetical protein